MSAHRIKTTIRSDKTLILEDLPFHSGEQVEVIIVSRPQQKENSERYSLRGTRVEYIEPMEPVAQEDWESLQ
jgi:hypothetical protein